MRTMGYMPTEMELTELGQQIRMNCEAGEREELLDQGRAKGATGEEREAESGAGDREEGKRDGRSGGKQIGVYAGGGIWSS